MKDGPALSRDVGRAPDDGGSRTDVIENKVRREDRKKYIDQIAAVFILQGYLDQIRNEDVFGV